MVFRSGWAFLSDLSSKIVFSDLLSWNLFFFQKEISWINFFLKIPLLGFSLYCFEILVSLIINDSGSYQISGLSWYYFYKLKI